MQKLRAVLFILPFAAFACADEADSPDAAQPSADASFPDASAPDVFAPDVSEPDASVPDAFEPEANAAANLVYGIGPHVCPGRPLARLELRELVHALLAAAPEIALAGDPTRELPPLGGFRAVPVRFAFSRE